MSFREWLPKTERNRVAFVFAHFALILFLVWNLIPVPPAWGGSSRRLFAFEFWQVATNWRLYFAVFKSPSIWGMMAVAASLAIFIASAVSVLIVPFWKFFQATPILRMPIAAASICGALIICAGLFAGGYGWGLLELAFALVALNMFCVSVAMFTFGNELGWKPRALDPRVPKRNAGESPGQRPSPRNDSSAP